MSANESTSLLSQCPPLSAHLGVLAPAAAAAVGGVEGLGGGALVLDGLLSGGGAVRGLV